MESMKKLLKLYVSLARLQKIRSLFINLNYYILATNRIEIFKNSIYNRTEIVKYLAKIWTKEMKNLHMENYKILLKILKKT